MTKTFRHILLLTSALGLALTVPRSAIAVGQLTGVEACALASEQLSTLGFAGKCAYTFHEDTRQWFYIYQIHAAKQQDPLLSLAMIVTVFLLIDTRVPAKTGGYIVSDATGDQALGISYEAAVYCFRAYQQSMDRFSTCIAEHVT